MKDLWRVHVRTRHGTRVVALLMGSWPSLSLAVAYPLYFYNKDLTTHWQHWCRVRLQSLLLYSSNIKFLYA